MKTTAAVLYEMGGSMPYISTNPLVVKELDLTPPGSQDVLVELTAAGLCHSDLSVVNGDRPRIMPMVMGHEATGIIRELGSNVEGLAVGDNVVFSFVPLCGRCEFCLGGRGALCSAGAKANAAGTLLSGAKHFTDEKGNACHHHLGVSAFSQFTVANAGSVVKIDNDIEPEIAALFGCAVMTGVGAVFNTAMVQPGRSAAVFGLGGVGLSSVMGAKAAGANPLIAIDVVEEKLTLAREIGATHAVNAAKEDAVKFIKDVTGGGAEYVFESVGSEQVLMQAYQSTGRGGSTISMGLPHPDRMFSIPAFSLAAEERTVKGSYMGSSVPSRDIPRYISMYRAGMLPVDKLHTHTLALNEINEGFDRLHRGEGVRQIIKF